MTHQERAGSNHNNVACFEFRPSKWLRPSPSLALLRPIHLACEASALQLQICVFDKFTRFDSTQIGVSAKPSTPAILSCKQPIIKESTPNHIFISNHSGALVITTFYQHSIAVFRAGWNVLICCFPIKSKQCDGAEVMFENFTQSSKGTPGPPWLHHGHQLMVYKDAMPQDTKQNIV